MSWFTKENRRIDCWFIFLITNRFISQLNSSRQARIMSRLEKVVVLILCVLLAVLLIGTAFIYNQNLSLKVRVKTLENEKLALESQLSALENEKNYLQALVDKLQGEYSELKTAYDALELNYSSLKIIYDSLQANYSALENKYQNLNEDFDLLSTNYTELLKSHEELAASYSHITENYEEWLAFAETYFSFNESFGRTLSENEISSLVPTVKNITSNPNDWWRSAKQLYDYVAYNIYYVYDEPFPVPPTIHELETDTYENETSVEIFMSPAETLELQQGDCDDQAVLLYGLVKAYDKYVYGVDYKLWAMVLTFGEDAAHLAVALPVGNGELTIIDPAGQYYTGWPGGLSSNDPYEELENYSESWSSYGGIEHIMLYEIEDGIAREVASGNIQEVASFIQNLD